MVGRVTPATSLEHPAHKHHPGIRSALVITQTNKWISTRERRGRELC